MAVNLCFIPSCCTGLPCSLSLVMPAMTHSELATYHWRLAVNQFVICQLTLPGRQRKLVYMTNISYLLSLCRSFTWHVSPTLHFFPETGFGDLVYWFAPGPATCMLSCNSGSCH
jgi:hypothetical protein